ncbi:MAG TPA: TfoX/Sxy family protein [Sunxiuqinia sp.]|nr:TfoX/Sxy family protein [Sunxiuqinia sp.]
MAYDEFLAERIQRILQEQKATYEEKKMFGGTCFMVNDKMCLGVIKNDLMARIDPENENQFLNDDGARPMDFSSQPMKGYIFVNQKGTDLDDDLERWVNRCLAFNPKAKSSKKKRK